MASPTSSRIQRKQRLHNPKDRGRIVKGKEKSSQATKNSFQNSSLGGQNFESSIGMAAAAAKVQATSLPDHIPAGDVASSSILKTSTLPPTATPFIFTSAFTPSLSFSESSRKTTTVYIYTSESPTPSASSHSSKLPSSNTPGHLPVFIFVLIGVGAASLVAAAFIFLKCILRRGTRTGLSTPSNPILQDSPLFGGKERLSRGLWSDPSFGNNPYTPTKTGGSDLGNHKDGWRPLNGANNSNVSKSFGGKQPLKGPPYLAEKSAELSPASVYTVLPPAKIGIALDFPLPDHAIGGTQPLKVKDKATNNKTVRRRSIAHSMYGGAEVSSPALTESTYAYQTPRPAPTPGKPKPALVPSMGSRERVQAPSYRKVAPSQGESVRRQSMSRSKKGESFLHAIPIVKSPERRDRDTKALTSALGLGSPPPPSSCFSPVSLYPDDSLSVMHGRPSSEMPSPTGTHAALGSLMLQEFSSVATFASLKSGDPFSGGETKKKGTSGRSDKPPRVPSPPPLPSLAQMAMANSDPDYRSPTYSIYGLYEAQRKSKASAGGDFM